jgi:tetratricopeptide (TPR) repeat protein
MKPYLSHFFKSVSASTLALLVIASTAMPSFAADPFRTKNARPISNETQKVFELMFRDGNYTDAVKYVDAAVIADPNEPLIFVLRASTAFAKADYLGMQKDAKRVRTNAEALKGKDNLRAFTYMAVADLLEAGYIFKTEGLASAGKILPMVSGIFDNLQKAKDIAPEDPELNLIKGYVDMLIASVFPLSDLETALESLKVYAAPDYLKWRGIAIAYRDANKTNLALDAVNKAIASAPENPELNYLKGQLLWSQGGSNVAAAKQQFEIALTKSEQMNTGVLADVREQCRVISGGVKCPEGKK